MFELETQATAFGNLGRLSAVEYEVRIALVGGHVGDMVKELFMPRLLERDEAIRRGPTEGYPWDGIGEVRPFGASEKKIVEGVY